MIFYVGANWASQQRMRNVRDVLRSLGHAVRASWLDEESAQAFDTLTPTQRAEYSYRDLGEILSADALTIDTLYESNTGGREVEFGVAIATAKQTWLVGPERNIFHTIAKRQFGDWGEVFAYLKGQA